MDWLLKTYTSDAEKMKPQKPKDLDSDCLDYSLQLMEVVGISSLALLFGVNMDMDSFNLAQKCLGTIGANMISLKWTTEDLIKWDLPFANEYLDCLSMGLRAVNAPEVEDNLQAVEMIEMDSVSFSYATGEDDAQNDDELGIKEFSKKEFVVQPTQLHQSANLTNSCDEESCQPLSEELSALKNFSFRFELGKVYSIVGKNGSGKSTLVGLLTKLYTPSEGKIHINGSDLATIPDESWLKQLAVVPQNFSELWDFSIRDNIAFGCHELLSADPNHVIDKEAEYFGVTDFVDLDTYFGDKYNSKGIPETEGETWVDDFSGGQWQAIVLARAFCRRDSARVFILDEPSSALDPVREHSLFERLRQEKDGRITIFISHGLRTCRASDCILVMDNGRLVQSGSHTDLLRETDGIYAELHRLQNESW